MIRIIAGGKRHKGWLAEFCEEYDKRLRKPFVVEWQFVEEEKLGEKVARLGRIEYVIVLDERGKMLDSVAFAECLSKELESGREVVLVVGGAFGHFAPEVLERADLVLSLSKMVLPHQLCRALVIEQIYRAQEIWAGGKYHHA